jgi:hypothetical protein
MDAAVWCAGNQGGAARGFRAVKGDGYSVDAVRVTAFDDRELVFAQRAENHIAFAGHGFSVEVGVRDALDHLPVMIGCVA